MKIATTDALARFVEFLGKQSFPLDVSWSPWKDARTSAQNRYLFGVCYPPIAAAKGYNVDEVHEFMCGTHFGWVDKAHPKTPRNPEGLASIPFRTTTRDENGKRDVLKKKAFSQFVDTVHRIAANAGIFISEAWEE